MGGDVGGLNKPEMSQFQFGNFGNWGGCLFISKLSDLKIALIQNPKTVQEVSRHINSTISKMSQIGQYFSKMSEIQKYLSVQWGGGVPNFSFCM